MDNKDYYKLFLCIMKNKYKRIINYRYFYI